MSCEQKKLEEEGPACGNASDRPPIELLEKAVADMLDGKNVGAGREIRRSSTSRRRGRRRPLQTPDTALPPPRPLGVGPVDRRRSAGPKTRGPIPGLAGLPAEH